MKNLFFLLFCIPIFLFSQKKKLRPVYGFALNSGLERLSPEQKDLDVKKNFAVGCYISIGFHFKLDSTYLLYTGLRYGKESSRFQLQQENSTYQFRTANLPLSFVFAPGVKLNKNSALFLNLSVTRVFQANSGGGGGGERNGKQYSFTYISNLPQNSWEFRPGLKWQIHPREEKKLAFELGIEPSLLSRRVRMLVKKSNPNLTGTEYRMDYELIMLYTGILF